MHVKEIPVPMPRRYSMQARAQQATATRTRLLQAAVEVLAEVGVAQLTMQAVAERADTALRTVYNHFPSKEALVVDAYDGVANYVKDAVAAIPGTGCPQERLGWFTDAVFDSYQHESPGAAAIMRVTGVPEYDAHLADVRAWRREQLTALLRPADRAGSLKVPLKEAVALAFAWTAFATWASLVDESGLSPAAARQLARRSLTATLFGTTPADPNPPQT
jgi:AcrR family transcriptional regulator